VKLRSIVTTTLLLRASAACVAVAEGRLTSPGAKSVTALSEEEGAVGIAPAEQRDRNSRHDRRKLLEFEVQPCPCQCTHWKDGREGVLVTKTNKNAMDKCIRYGAVQRRIDRGRVACVSEADCTQERVDAATDVAIEMAEMEPVCDCTCERSKNHWGVYIEVRGKIQCARNGRADRSKVKGRATCVPANECPPFEDGGLYRK